VADGKNPRDRQPDAVDNVQFPAPATRCRVLNEERKSFMNSDQLEGTWDVVKGKIQKQWGKLTNDDLDVIEGNRKEIAGRIQQRYGYAKERAEREVNTWLEKL
jgi:uncharacterized protein YjbJ (UPF0337 family)